MKTIEATYLEDIKRDLTLPTWAWKEIMDMDEQRLRHNVIFNAAEDYKRMREIGLKSKFKQARESMKDFSPKA